MTMSEETPAPVGAAVALDLDALHETICDNFTDMAEVRQAADLLVAEVCRLTRWQSEALPVMVGLQDLGSALGMRLGESITGHAAAEAARALTARAEAAEAEVVTLRAKLAEGRRIVGMLAETVESGCEDDPGMCHEHDRTDDGRCPLLVDLNRAHAALAVTSGEGQ